LSRTGNYVYRIFDITFHFLGIFHFSGIKTHPSDGFGKLKIISSIFRLHIY